MSFFQVFGFTFPAIIVPEVFVPKLPEYQTKPDELTKAQKEELNRHKSVIDGDQSEKACFENVHRLLAECRCSKRRRNQNNHKCIMKTRPNLRIFNFSGTEFVFPDQQLKKTLTAEFDNIFIIDELKVIVYCELKGAFSKAQARKKKQFLRFKELIEAHFPVGEGWKLVTSYGFTRYPENAKRPCDKCSKFVFLVNDFGSMLRWFENLAERLEPPVTHVGKKTIYTKVDFSKVEFLLSS